MNNFADIQIDVIDPQTNYGVNATVIAEIVKIVKVEQGYTIVALRDFTGVENTALIRGRSKPAYANINQVSVFVLSGKTGARGAKYSGFYNPQDQVPPEFAGKKPPAPAQGQGAPAGQGGGGKSYDNGKNRGFALSYAKDLVVAGKVDIKLINACTDTFVAFLDTGKWPGVEQPVISPVVELEIPEVGVNVNQDPYVQSPAITQGPSLGQVTGQTGVGGQPPFSPEDVPF